jgi:hypothetical protein
MDPSSRRDGLVVRLLELLRQSLCSFAHDCHSFTTARLLHRITSLPSVKKRDPSLLDQDT